MIILSVFSKLSVFDFSLLIAYALVCIAIGLWSSRKQTDENFLIAGRKIGKISFTSSIVASYVGGSAIVAFSAFVYKFGISSISLFVGSALGFLAFIPFARKLRSISSEKQFHTFSDWFYYRFKNKKIGLLSAIVQFIVYFGMLMNQFVAGSTLLSNFSGWEYHNALIFSSVIISLYLVIGGFRSVIKTDVFQYIVLVVLFFFLVFIMLKNPEEVSVHILDFLTWSPTMTIALLIFGFFVIFQTAEYWQRVYAAKSQKVIKQGLLGAMTLVVITGLALTVIGMVAREYVPGLTDASVNNAFAEGLTILVPKNLKGIGLILIFAAIMSSADTQIFVMASSLAKDFSQVFGIDKTDNHQIMKYTRIFIIVLAILATAFAFFFRDLIAVFVFITGLGFSIIPAALASFKWELKEKAVIWSFISGLTYVATLLIIAIVSTDNPMSFFTNNSELALGSILFSGLTLWILQKTLRIK